MSLNTAKERSRGTATAHPPPPPPVERAQFRRFEKRAAMISARVSAWQRAPHTEQRFGGHTCAPMLGCFAGPALKARSGREIGLVYAVSVVARPSLLKRRDRGRGRQQQQLDGHLYRPPPPPVTLAAQNVNINVATKHSAPRERRGNANEVMEAAEEKRPRSHSPGWTRAAATDAARCGAQRSGHKCSRQRRRSTPASAAALCLLLWIKYAVFRWLSRV